MILHLYYGAKGGLNMNEPELVLKAKKGDVNAFCKLYDMYKNKLYNYAYYKLGNSSDAEDVVQDCILTAFEQIKKLKKPEAFSAWIFKILYYGCCSYINNQISQRNTEDIENYKSTLSYNNSYDFEREELKEALNILKDEEKNIVLLSVIAGFKSKEIARITGYSAVNVRQKLSRSLAKMKKYLS